MNITQKEKDIANLSNNYPCKCFENLDHPAYKDYEGDTLVGSRKMDKDEIPEILNFRNIYFCTYRCYICTNFYNQCAVW